MKTLSKMGGFTLLAVACLTIMVGCVIVPGLPSIARQLGVEHASGWLVTLPSLGVVIFGPLAGRIAHRIGLYPSLCYGLFFYGLFGAAGVFMHGTVAVFADRILLGGATAIVMSTGTGMISVFFRGEQRMQMIARQGMSIELGGVIFLFIGGLLATAGWRWPFCLYLFAWILLGLVLAFVPKTPAHGVAEEEGEATQTQAPQAIRLTYMAAVFSMITFFTAIILLPLHFHALGITEAQTGYFLSFVSLVAVFAAWLMPKLIKRFSDFGTLCVAFACYGVAHLLFAFAPSMPLFILGGVALGCGFGFSIPLVNHLIVELSSLTQRAHNLARLSMAIFLGQFLSAFMGYLSQDTRTLFLAAGVFALGVCGFFISQKRRLENARKPLPLRD
jgi:MFS family permease